MSCNGWIIKCTCGSKLDQIPLSSWSRLVHCKVNNFPLSPPSLKIKSNEKKTDLKELINWPRMQKREKLVKKSSNGGGTLVILMYIIYYYCIVQVYHTSITIKPDILNFFVGLYRQRKSFHQYSHKIIIEINAHPFSV